MKSVLRVGHPRYFTDEAFSEHIEFVKNNIDAFDEITLFTEFDHNGYREPEELRATVDVLKKRIPAYRALGFKSVGINVLCTLGHLEEAYDAHSVAPFGYVVNRDGVASKSCICPSSPECLDYIYQRYSAFAECGADFIWIDDDVRVSNHGVVRSGDYCFCDNCISRFNFQNGTSYTRADLVGLWSVSDVREKYIAMQVDILNQVCDTIKRAVQDTDPTVKIGIMNDASKVYPSTIVSSGAVMVRPGGGFYTDTSPIYVFDKNFRIQSSVANYLGDISDIQYEYESFSFQSFEKSKHITELETTLAIMAGCTGALYSMGWFYDREDITEHVKSKREKWNSLSQSTRGALYTGVYCTNPKSAFYLIEAGIPVTSAMKNAALAFVVGNDWSALSDEEIEKILDLNVYTDGLGAKILSERGFSDALGGRVLRKYDNSMCERFSDHPINGEYKQFFRNAFMSFPYTSDAYSLEPQACAECISNLEDVAGRPYGVSAYIFEHPSGRRICVDGYMLPDRMKSKHKRVQLDGIFDYLSRGKMPVKICKMMKIIPTVNTDSDGNLTVMLTNATFDPTGSFECVMNTEREVFEIGENGEYTAVPSAKRDGKTVVSIKNLSPWGYVLLTTKR